MTADPRPLRALLWLTFLESFGTILLERGVYFYTHDVLAFTERENLWLAFAFGVTYVVGALGSHTAAERFGEKRLLISSLLALLVVHGLLTLQPSTTLLVLSFPVIGLLQGVKWPVVESYVSAGRTPHELVRLLARYNVTWALAVPLAMVSSGPLIALGPSVLFAVAAVLNVAAALCAIPLAAKPLHLDHAHPERPSARELSRFSALLVSARFCMLLSYSLLFLLAPLMPGLFERLGLELSRATAAAGFLDVARVGCFALLGVWVGWRGRAAPLLLGILVLPVSFALILFGNNLLLVLLGELLYGLAAGFSYTAALYYALVVKNASVDAGGAHEGLIGLGFALGPLAGIGAHAVTGLAGGYVLSMVLCTAPLLVVCTFLGLRPLRSLA